jgi:uncharacterized protein (TIGR02594 family)
MMIRFGVVRDNNDPLKTGRVRVQVFHVHDDTIETENLPWSTVITPATSPSTGGVGTTPHLMVGTHVIGSFIDTYNQHFLVLGTFFGEGDIPAPALENYPNNHVTVSESGHLIEIDDTPTKERIHINHRSGSRIEFQPNGDIILAYKDKSELSTNSSVIINGNSSVYVNGDSGVTVTGDASLNIGGNYNIYANRIDLNSSWGGGNAGFVENKAFYKPNIIQVQIPDDNDNPDNPINNEQKESGSVGTICAYDKAENPYTYARGLLDLKWEETGDTTNIKQLWDELGVMDSDYAIKNKIAWCTVFVSAVLKRSGHKYLKTAYSLNYKNYGDDVLGTTITDKINNAVAGDILVFSRGGNAGHVGFYTGEYNSTNGRIGVLGGNQGNTLKVSYITTNGAFMKLVAIRRPKGCAVSDLTKNISASECSLPTTINKNDDLQAMALNIYFEARGESDEGQIAVAWVVKNRTFSNLFPNNYASCVYQPKQFSWYEDGKSNIPDDKESYCKALDIAIKVMNNEVSDPTGGSVWYHAIRVKKPVFSIYDTVESKTIGKHIFYVFADKSKNPVVV